MLDVHLGSFSALPTNDLLFQKTLTHTVFCCFGDGEGLMQTFHVLKSKNHRPPCRARRKCDDFSCPRKKCLINFDLKHAKRKYMFCAACNAVFALDNPAS